MEFITKLSGSLASFNSMFQIGVDVIILGLLGVILTVKKLRISKKDEAIMKSFEKIVEETAQISQRFEINLEKRQDLLQQITAKLDQRIQQAESLCTRLETEFSRINTDKLAVQPPSSAGPHSQGADQQKILLLARKGLDASEIAKSLRRPVGEVELILNLQKISL
ncbi:MAG: DUF6115 domain-containing protein [Syntrophobacteraceae bacterium]